MVNAFAQGFRSEEGGLRPFTRSNASQRRPEVADDPAGGGRRGTVAPWVGCGAALTLLAGVAAGQVSTTPNVLLVIADDMGVDRVGAYGESADPGKTPTIDALATGGVLFRNAYASPLCSPTRAMMLSGRYGYRTGVGAVYKENPPLGNPLDEPPEQYYFHPGTLSLPFLMGGGTGGPYTTGAIGKWHLADQEEAPDHPLDTGFDLHSGSLFNIDDYYWFAKTVNGNGAIVTQYATTDTTDDALRAIESMPEPWFLWLSYNAPHTPTHVPPDHLHSYELEGAPAGDKINHTKAAIEAMDTEIGRLLDSMDPQVRIRTNIIFIGDNGTAGGAVEPPIQPDKAKHTLFEGGINVPLIVNGPSVGRPGSECAALVHATDIFSTVLELGGRGGDLNPMVDSVSFVPYLDEPELESLREFVYSERFFPNGFGPFELYRRTIRDQRYKVIDLWPDGETYFFDLQEDPWEEVNLLEGTLSPEEANAFDRLWSTMTDMNDPSV